jgi:hypothetical protein
LQERVLQFGKVQNLQKVLSDFYPFFKILDALRCLLKSAEPFGGSANLLFFQSRPITETISENIEQIRLLIDDGPYLTIEELQQKTDLSYGAIHRIISNYLNLRKVAARYIPRDFNELNEFEYVKRIYQNFNKEHDDYVI